MMDSQEDAALLVLIHQHLQLRGHSAAAQLLEEHLTQVEMPMESLNLHDIYTGWMKLCSLAQRAKQETEIDLKTGIVKQVEKAEEVAPVEPLIEADPEVVSEPHLDSSSFEGEAKEEREETFRGVELQPVQAEGRSSVSASSNTEKTSEPIQGDPDPIVQPETPAISEPIEVSDSQSEQEMEDRQGGDEEEQRAAINSPEETKGTSEQIDVAQGALVCSSRETNVAAEEEKEEEEEEEEEEEQHAAAERPVSSDLPAEESSIQALEREGLSPADTVFENPQETFPRTEGEGSSSEMEPENEPKAAIKDQRDADPPGKAEEIKEDEDDCTILNIQADCSEAAVLEPVELCGDSATPRKKKKKKKKSSNNGCAETSQVDLTDTLRYDAACTDTPLTSTSKKKKRREKKTDEMLNGEEEDKTEAAEQSQLVTPKKKAKKRKRRGDEMEENQDETIIPPEKLQKKKLLDVMEDKTEMGGMDDSNLPEMKQKKKKKKKKRGELQFKEAPAEGSKEEINAAAENSNISTAKKKKHVRTKLSLKKRLMFRKKEMMMKTARRTHSPNQILAGRKRHKQKSPQLNTERESSSKENQPPSKKKNKKRAVGDIPEVPEDESTIPKEHRKKKLRAEEISPPVVVDQLPPAKKKKKDRLKIKLEEAEDVDCSGKKKKSHKKRKN